MKKTKILFIVLIVLFVGCFLIASQASAQGLVPCGRTEDVPSTAIDESAPCSLCHFFILIEIILEFVFFKLTPPLALLMLIIGGGMFILAAGNPTTIITARKIITSVLIGIVIIYGAFFLIGIFLSSIHLATWTEQMYSQWWNQGIFTIDCDVPMSAPPPNDTSAPPSDPMPNVFNPPIEPTAVLTSIPINQNFSIDGEVFTFHTEPIFTLAVFGEVTILREEGYARVILVNENEKEYLVYEAAGPLNSGSFSFENRCEETCLLDGVIPKTVKVELEGARIRIDKISTLENREALKPKVHTMGIESYASDLNKNQEQAKIDKINQYIEKHELQWTAGRTSVSELSYQQKKGLCGTEPSSTDTHIPKSNSNQGLTREKPQQISQAQKTESGFLNVFSPPFINSVFAQTSSDMPPHFDWRNKNSSDYTTSIKNQRGCGSCWAFAILAGLESQIEIDRHNPDLNPDLSEQDLVSCYPHYDCCRGALSLGPVLRYIEWYSVATEKCFPYTGIDARGCSTIDDILNNELKDPTLCSEKCSDWRDDDWTIDSYTILYLSSTEELKQTIYTKGPVIASMGVYADFVNYSGGIYEHVEGGILGTHSVVLVGYGTEGERTYWIAKNSWGTDWGEQGWFRIFTGESHLNAYAIINSPKYSEKECDCTDWTDKSCGGNDCALEQMWQTRSCDPPGCAKESQCIDDSSCSSMVCPNCWSETDLCEIPPRCEKECGAPIKCDEKVPDSGWSSGDICHWCNFSCDHGSDNYKPLSHYLSGDACYYDCSIKCTGSGWECSENYKSESCPEFKTSDNQCYYQRRCAAGGCKYSNSDPKPCAKAVCGKSGWDISLCEELSCYTKTKSGSAQWLECNSGDVMVGWYHHTNNWGDDDIRIKCCEIGDASLVSCSIEEKEGSDLWMRCGYNQVCTGKYHWTNNWGADNLKTKCCDITGVSLYSSPCYTKEKSGSDQWIECNYGDVMISWYHWTNNWDDDDLKIRCCSIE